MKQFKGYHIKNIGSVVKTYQTYCQMIELSNELYSLWYVVDGWMVQPPKDVHSLAVLKSYPDKGDFPEELTETALEMTNFVCRMEEVIDNETIEPMFLDIRKYRGKDTESLDQMTKEIVKKYKKTFQKS